MRKPGHRQIKPLRCPRTQTQRWPRVANTGLPPKPVLQPLRLQPQQRLVTGVNESGSQEREEAAGRHWSPAPRHIEHRLALHPADRAAPGGPHHAAMLGSPGRALSTLSVAGTMPFGAPSSPAPHGSQAGATPPRKRRNFTPIAELVVSGQDGVRRRAARGPSLAWGLFLFVPKLVQDT